MAFGKRLMNRNFGKKTVWCLNQKVYCTRHPWPAPQNTPYVNEWMQSFGLDLMHQHAHSRKLSFPLHVTCLSHFSGMSFWNCIFDFCSSDFLWRVFFSPHTKPWILSERSHEKCRGLKKKEWNWCHEPLTAVNDSAWENLLSVCAERWTWIHENCDDVWTEVFEEARGRLLIHEFARKCFMTLIR